MSVMSVVVTVAIMTDCLSTAQLLMFVGWIWGCKQFDVDQGRLCFMSRPMLESCWIHQVL